MSRASKPIEYPKEHRSYTVKGLTVGTSAYLEMLYSKLGTPAECYNAIDSSVAFRTSPKLKIDKVVDEEQLTSLAKAVRDTLVKLGDVVASQYANTYRYRHLEAVNSHSYPLLIDGECDCLPVSNLTRGNRKKSSSRIDLEAPCSMEGGKTLYENVYAVKKRPVSKELILGPCDQHQLAIVKNHQNEFSEVKEAFIEELGELKYVAVTTAPQHTGSDILILDTALDKGVSKLIEITLDPAIASGHLNEISGNMMFSHELSLYRTRDLDVRIATLKDSITRMTFDKNLLPTQLTTLVEYYYLVDLVDTLRGFHAGKADHSDQYYYVPIFKIIFPSLETLDFISRGSSNRYGTKIKGQHSGINIHFSSHSRMAFIASSSPGDILLIERHLEGELASTDLKECLFEADAYIMGSSTEQYMPEDVNYSGIKLLTGEEGLPDLVKYSGAEIEVYTPVYTPGEQTRLEFYDSDFKCVKELKADEFIANNFYWKNDSRTIVNLNLVVESGSVSKLSLTPLGDLGAVTLSNPDTIQLGAPVVSGNVSLFNGGVRKALPLEVGVFDDGLLLTLK